MPEPRITATGDNAGVRPYGGQHFDRYGSPVPEPFGFRDIGDFAVGAAGAIGSAGRGAYRAGGRFLSDVDDMLSGNSPEQQWRQMRAEDDRLYDEARRGILRDTPFSRQARITASSRAIENAPYAAAERATEEEQRAAMTDMRIEEKRTADMAAAEARAQELYEEKLAADARKLAAENERIRLMQEQQALQSGLPIGPSIPFSKKPAVSTPTGMAAAPEPRSALAPDQGYIGARVDGLIGSYSKNMPTYTEAKTAGNVGTIDLRADAPVKQEMGGEDYLMQAAISAAQRGDTQTADTFSKIAKVSAETAKLRAETSKTKSDEQRGAVTAEKEMAETVKTYAETDKLMREIAAGDKPVSRERMMISGGQAAMQLGKDLSTVVEAELARDTSYMAAATPEERSAIRDKHRADALRYLQSDPIRAPLFKMVDMLSLDLDSDQAAADAKNVSTTSTKSPTDLEDIWTAK